MILLAQRTGCANALKLVTYKDFFWDLLLELDWSLWRFSNVLRSPLIKPIPIQPVLTLWNARNALEARSAR